MIYGPTDPYNHLLYSNRDIMKFHKIIHFLILTLFPSILFAGEISGNIEKLLYIDMKNPASYPKKHILGNFGNKVITDYSIGIATNRRGTHKFLNFHIYPNNITKKSVQLTFTVEFYDKNGNLLGKAQRNKHMKPLAPTDPNFAPTALHGSNVKESDYNLVKKYKIVFNEK